jgi:peptidoglycan hydrolase-like protein with peptidoglycan-binding domain
VGTPENLTSPLRWRRSLDASRARRAARARRRRVALCGRTGIALALASTAIAAGGALAHEPAPTAGEAIAPSQPEAAVEAVQRALGVEVDGIVGPQTRAAVRRFQREQGLVVDGIPGPQTRRALGLQSAVGPAEPPAALERAAPAEADGDASPATAPSATLERIAACESGGDPTAVSPDGRYRGKYQFSRATWRALGGEGDPAAAPEAEQDRRAARLLARRGTAPWPVCGG